MSGESFGNIGLHLGSDVQLRCHVYSGSLPILVVDAGRCELTLSPRTRTTVDDGDVQLARRLVETASAYLAEIERIHAEQSGDTAA